MKKSVIELSHEGAALLDLGAVLGQNQAFGLVAGRCSAAQAATLMRLRQEKKYLHCAANWREFCSKYLKISGSEANRIIRHWEEFGPAYFELAQLIRISPEGYRAVQPAVKDGALHYDGEAIGFDEENSRKLAAAAAELRGAAPRRKRSAQAPRQRELQPHERIAEIDRRGTQMVLEFQEIGRKERSGENWILFARALTRVRSELARVERENGL
jgi:hypothetical protein